MIILHFHLQPQFKYELFHILHIISLLTGDMNSIDLAPNVWLHSSVGRATHRQRVGHRFESRWSPDFFQASSFQLLIGKFTAMIILHFYNHSVVDVVNIMLFFSKVLVSIFFIFQIKSWASGEIAARTWCTRHRNQVCVETSNKIYS